MEVAEKKIIDYSEKTQSQSRSQVEPRSDRLGSELEENIPFNQIFFEVESQIEIDCFSSRNIDMANEICLIIAEIYKLPPCALVRIGGNNLSADIVRAIYCRLRHEHIEDVIDNYHKVTYPIKHIKTYLRTALYNSVFELSARAENEVAYNNCCENIRMKNE